MTIILKAFEIGNSLDGINNILNQKGLNAVATISLNRLSRYLSEELKLINEARDRIIKNYASTDENGNSLSLIRPEDENFEIADKEFKDLMNSEIIIQTEKIKLDLLKKFIPEFITKEINTGQIDAEGKPITISQTINPILLISDALFSE